MGTAIDATHSVEEDQFEPRLPKEEQARFHVLDMELLSWTLQARVGLTKRIGRYRPELQLDRSARRLGWLERSDDPIEP